MTGTVTCFRGPRFPFATAAEFISLIPLVSGWVWLSAWVSELLHNKASVSEGNICLHCTCEWHNRAPSSGHQHCRGIPLTQPPQTAPLPFTVGPLGTSASQALKEKKQERMKIGNTKAERVERGTSRGVINSTCECYSRENQSTQVFYKHGSGKHLLIAYCVPAPCP